MESVTYSRANRPPRHPGALTTGQDDLEGSAASGAGHHGEKSAMGTDDVVAQGEAGLVASALARILDENGHAPLVPPRAHAQPALAVLRARHGLERMPHQG